MEDHSLSGQTWVIFALTAVTISLGAVVFYLWLRRRRFTRQRYAFFCGVCHRINCFVGDNQHYFTESLVRRRISSL